MQNSKNSVSFESYRKAALISLSIIFYLLLRYYLGILPYFFLVDDAYITLRYADNFVTNGELVYNLGEYIFGITTIFLPLLLASIIKISPFAIDLVVLMKITTLITECLCIVLSAFLFYRNGLSKYVAIFIGVSLISNYLFMSSSQGGMETSLFCLSILLIVLTVNSQPLTSSYFSGIALFIRPEGAIMVGLLFFLNLFMFKQKKVFIILCLSLIAYFSFFYFFYGVYLPESLVVKRHIFAPYLSASKAMFSSAASLFPLGKISQNIRLIIVYIIIFYGALVWPNKNAQYILLILFPFVMFIMYSIENPPIWFWYTVPYVFCLSFFFFYGLSKAILSIFPKAFLLVILVLLIGANFKSAFISYNNLLIMYTTRVSGYYVAVERLKAMYGLNMSHSILTHEVGAIGYYSRAKIYDAVGLINPKLAPLGVVQEENSKYLKYGRATQKLIEATNPDFILFQKNYIDPMLLDSLFFKEKYTFLFTEPNTNINEDSGDLMVFIKSEFKKD